MLPVTHSTTASNTRNGCCDRWETHADRRIRRRGEGRHAIVAEPEQPATLFVGATVTGRRHAWWHRLSETSSCIFSRRTSDTYISATTTKCPRLFMKSFHLDRNFPNMCNTSADRVFLHRSKPSFSGFPQVCSLERAVGCWTMASLPFVIAQRVAQQTCLWDTEKTTTGVLKFDIVAQGDLSFLSPST